MAETNSKNSCNCGKRSTALVIVMCIVAIVLTGCFVWQTICFHKTHIPESISVSFINTKGQRKKLADEAEKKIKEQLFVAFMAMAEKAESNYNDKFMALLTILTIFGIVWPIVIAYLQKMNLEEDRAKITEALEKYISLSDDLQKQKTSNSEMIQTIEKMSEDLQKQKTSNSEMIQTIEKMSEVLQKQKTSNSEMIHTIEKMSEGVQKQKKEIRYLQMDNQLSFGAIQLKYAYDLGPKFSEKISQRIAYDSSDDLTMTFKILTDTWDTYYQGELIAMSENNDTHNFPFFIKDVSNKIYNLVVNYNNINFVEVISYLDEIITNVDRLNQHNSSIIEAVRFLKCAKMILEQDYSKSSTEEKS